MSSLDVLLCRRLVSGFLQKESFPFEGDEDIRASTLPAHSLGLVCLNTGELCSYVVKELILLSELGVLWEMLLVLNFLLF